MNTLRRALAHRVLHRGVVHRLAVVDISGSEITVAPFDAETASTPFVDGTVVVAARGCVWPQVEWPCGVAEAQLLVVPEIIESYPPAQD